MHELILGGARSGKSRAAEDRARRWLSASVRVPREAVLIATALIGDDEMRQRVARHRLDRSARVPALATVEVPQALPAALAAHSAAHRLVVVDCLTLWLTNLLMPMAGEGLDDDAWAQREAELLHALRVAAGPVVLVSNEIGLGGVALAREARRFADHLGRLHQRLALSCSRVTLMVAGLPLALKSEGS